MIRSYGLDKRVLQAVKEKSVRVSADGFAFLPVAIDLTRIDGGGIECAIEPYGSRMLLH